jgi:hypothetical protein
VRFRQHPGHGLLRDQKGAERGDLQRPLNLGRIQLDERSSRPRAGVVDDDIRSTCSRSTSANRRFTWDSSWASHGNARAPVSAQRASSLAVFRAAMATARPSFLNNRVSDALNPWPAPTINADL